MADFTIKQTGFAGRHNLYDPDLWYFGDFSHITRLSPAEEPEASNSFYDSIFFSVGDRILRLEGDFSKNVDGDGIPTRGTVYVASSYSTSGTELFTMSTVEKLEGFLDDLPSYVAQVLPRWYSLVQGAPSDDIMRGNAKSNSMGGGAGDDVIKGFGGQDDLNGHQGDDRIYGGGGNDQLGGQGGHDRLWGRAGDDALRGDGGRDDLFGGRGEDRLFGGGGSDTLKGNAHADELYGGGGRDHLYGGNGNDVLIGGPGKDFLYGGGGQDSFQFSDPKGDVIMDFGVGRDVIDLTSFSLDWLGGEPQPLDYRGSKRFTGAGDEVRFANEKLMADMDGDKKVDWVIHVKGVDKLTQDQVVTSHFDWPDWWSG